MRLKRFTAACLALMLVNAPFAAPSQVSADEPAVEAKINETLSGISLAERVSLMGGGSATAGAGATQTVTGLSRMNMSDGPNGVNAGGTGTSFESGLIVSSTWNPDHAYEVGRIIGAESKYKNVQILLGPGINIIRDLAGGRTFEYYSEDPILTGRIAAGYSAGMQSQEVGATVKHLFANNQEANRNWSSSNLSERAMHEVYLPPYKAAIESGGAWNLMTGANRANGVFTSDNRYIMTNMMKYAYGLAGVIMTDWCGTRSNVIAAKAGLDISMPNAGAFSGLLASVRSGFVPEYVVDQAAQRVTRLAYLTKSTTSADGYTPAQRMAGENYNVGSHANESVELAKEGEVLLKNNGLLPFTKANPTIALIGKYVAYDFEQSGLGGSSGTYPPVQVHNDTAIKNLYDNGHMPTGATFLTPAYNESSEDNLVSSINDAVAAAQAADYVIIYAGINKSAPEHQWGNAPDTEGNDRLNLDFPGEQLRLIQAVEAVAGAKTVVVLNGSVFEVADWIDGANAVLATFYPGQNGATATADILTGKVNPSGKLPFTWPKRYEDTQGYVPDVSNQETAKSDDVFYSEGVFEGYRYYDQRLNDEDPANDILPQFAFGHGLSYSTYNWSDITLSSNTMAADDAISASVTLTNTNNIAGKQVVQLYIQDPVSSVARPIKELKDFQKKQIAANGSQTFTFEITKDELSFWDVNTHSMKAEAGQFNILIGDSSDTICGAASFTLTADSAPDPDYTVVQAENYASQTGVTTGDVEEVDSAIMKYAPNRYVMIGGADSSVTWNVNVPEAGKYSIIFRYANDAFSGSASGYTSQYDKPTELIVNGEPYGSYDFQNTRSAKVWNYDSIDAVLDAGVNTITLKGAASSDGVRVDKLIAQKITQRWPDPVASIDTGGSLDPTDNNEFEAETTTMLSGASVWEDIDSASGGAYVKLNGAGSSATVPIYAPTSVRFRLQLTYSNSSGASAPCDLYVNGVKKFTYTLGPTGADDDWKFEQTDEITLLTGTNTLLFESKLGSVNLDKVTVLGGMAYIDSEAPIANGSRPSDGGGFISDISAYYSESVVKGPGTVTINDGDSVIASTFSVDGATLAVEPDRSRLVSGKTYTVTISPDAALDTSGNAADEPYSFTFTVPAANYSDPSIKYAGEWTDTGSAKTAGAGASLDFWYYGNQCVLRGLDGAAVVNIWKDDYLTPETVTISGDGSNTIAFFDTDMLQTGIHYIKLEVVSGTLSFVGPLLNKTLLDQPLPTVGWTVSGVRNDAELPNIVDGNRASRWTSLAVMNGANRDWFSIDLGRMTDINTLMLVCRVSNVGTVIQDYTRAYELFISNDNVNWIGPMTSGVGSPMFTSIMFPTVSTRYVKVVQTGNAPGDWWSVYEAYGFLAPEELVPAPKPPGTPTGLAATRINQQIKLTWNASEGAAYYQIFCDGELISSAAEPSYVSILEAGDDQLHVYAVKALTSPDIASSLSAPVSAAPDPGVVDIPRAGWRASASHTHSSVTPQSGIDDSLASRWVSGVGMTPGMWFTVDMGLTYKFNVITLVSNTTDYPSAYEIVVSHGGDTWSAPIATGVGAPNTTNIILPEAVTGRYIKIIQTGGARGDWWSIFDFNVAMRDDLANPNGLTAVGYNEFIRLDWFPPADVLFAAHHYDVYRNGVMIQGNVPNLRFVDTNVYPNRTYTYEVVAIAADGANSQKSKSASAVCSESNTRIPKDNWNADASVTHSSTSPNLAIDNIDDPPVGTKWFTGAAQDGNQVFYLNLNDVYPVDTVRISSDTADYGRQYEIKALTDNGWETVASGVSGTSGRQDITFDKVYTNAIQVCETGVISPTWWSVYELYAFNTSIPRQEATELKFAAARISASLKSKTLQANVNTDADPGALRYESSNPGIFTVDDSGLISLKRAGTAVLKVTTTDGSELSASAVIVIAP
ncbi:MAG: glycoside hydrolase family 3 C-terminal domain-containing protein [Clostridiales Family XIII bacterium]|jgi:beta-glucosidase|nr:glycoside hydrolase family 3 C-terminal domain-containing protein [Clostridiales Family XIII bacterium]